jgi:aldehyde dehydrogenase (NAD+)
VHEAVVKKFVEMMIVCIKRFWGESPNGSEDQGKIINNFHMERLTKLIDTSGGERLYGGRVNPEIKHI